jgi:hypothetical protein
MLRVTCVLNDLDGHCFAGQNMHASRISASSPVAMDRMVCSLLSREKLRGRRHMKADPRHQLRKDLNCSHGDHRSLATRRHDRWNLSPNCIFGSSCQQLQPHLFGLHHDPNRCQGDRCSRPILRSTREAWNLALDQQPPMTVF